MPMSQNLKHLNALEATKTTPVGNKPHPTADGLIDKAHRNATDRGFYLVGIDIIPLTLPTAELPMCIFKAVVKVRSDYEDGNGVMEFAGIGDATPQNCTSANTAAAYPRMAETRAVSRALAAALNVADAVAEEMVANGGVAPGAYVAAPAVAQPAVTMAGQPQGAAPAGGVNFNGQAYLRANGQALTAYTKDTRGKQLTDPTVEISTLQWMANNANLSDKVTPDAEFRNACLAEIARRNGTPPTITVAAQPVAAPAVAAPAMAPPGVLPPGIAPPVGQPVGVAPAAMTAAPPPPVAAPGVPAPATAAPPPPVGAPWVPNANDLQGLANAAATKGHDWAAMSAYVAQNFQGRQPQQLQKAEFSSVLVAYGAAPLP